MREPVLAHLASDADGVAAIVVLVVVPAVFITAEVLARRRERAHGPSGPHDASQDPADP